MQVDHATQQLIDWAISWNCKITLNAGAPLGDRVRLDFSRDIPRTV